MNDDRVSRPGNKCFKAGVCGTIIAAIYCATPILAVALASVGLAPIVPKLDYVLLPAPLIFLLLPLYAWLKGRDGGDRPR